jgi:hypothetical protein
MLWDPVNGWSPYGKPSHAAGITVGYNDTAQAFAEQLLNDRARELGNAGGRLRVTVGSYDPAGPPSEILAEAEITRPARASDRYVVARINKTYRTLDRQPGPQDVGKTFVPYDNRFMSKEAAEESARNSNDRYRPHLHGKTHIAVRAEPVPGTNKFRNLELRSLTGKARTSGDATQARRTSAAHGLGGEEPAAPARVVELDGKTVPLADCDWVEWAPCGCPVGTAAGRSVATEDRAWRDFYPRETDRERAQQQGYWWELMTHDRWSVEVADLMIAGCPHAGPAAETGAGRVTGRDKPAAPALPGGAGFPDFPLAPSASPAATSGRRPPGSGARDVHVRAGRRS